MKRLHLVPGLMVLGFALLAVTAGRSDEYLPPPPATSSPHGGGPGPAGAAIRVRAELLKRDLAQSFRRSFPVYEKAPEEGEFSSRVQVAARAYLAPVPCSRAIALDVVVYGNLWGNSVRSAGSVAAFTQERSSFFITQGVALDDRRIWLGGLGVSMPVCSTLLGIDTCLRGPLRDIVEDVGPALFERRRCKDDERITSETEKQLYRSITEEAQKTLRDANKWYREEFLDRITKAGVNPGELHFSSDLQAVYLTAALAGQRLPEAPPLPDRGIALRLHPDTFNLLANRSVAGKSYNEAELEKFNTDLSRYLNLPPLAKREERPLVVTMAKKDPLTLKIEGETLNFTMSGESYKVGDEVYPGMNVTARYRVVRKGDELHLVRDAELEVLPPDFKLGMTLGARQQTLRILLRRRLGRLLPQDVALLDIPILQDDLPKAIREQGLKISGTFRIDVIETAKGWLTVGARFSKQEEKPPLLPTQP